MTGVAGGVEVHSGGTWTGMPGSMLASVEAWLWGFGAIGKMIGVRAGHGTRNEAENRQCQWSIELGLLSCEESVRIEWQLDTPRLHLSICLAGWADTPVVMHVSSRSGRGGKPPALLYFRGYLEKHESARRAACLDWFRQHLRSIDPHPQGLFHAKYWWTPTSPCNLHAPVLRLHPRRRQNFVRRAVFGNSGSWCKEKDRKVR
ncbi:hypothetical protein QBC44DRAFT_313273 [Cladorrhinum sp. PSN332]|nr:hypothetical protein QBC44DRAFT_313273 [Cladorrhinum sp. PSN332]